MEQPNPRAVIGDNRPDVADTIAIRLSKDYAALSQAAARLLSSAAVLPEQIADERELEGVSNVVVAMRDAIARAEAARVAEKEPHLRAGQEVDGWFGSLKERLDDGDRSLEKVVGRAMLQRRIDAYQSRKLAAERERRRLEADRLRREEEERRATAARLAREAEEKRLAAERARKPEIKETKGELASAAEGEAATAIAAAAAAANAAEAARIDTLRPPSEIARSRFDEGRLVTMREVGFADVVDADKLDAVALWPFVNIKAKEVALRAWAKANGHARQMDGAVIGKRDEAVVR